MFPLKSEADSFFTQLAKFSERLITKTLPGLPTTSRNVSALRYGRHKGAILHYTASAGWKSPTKWFLMPENKASSAHVVVCDRLLAEAAGLADDLPLIKALPVTVIQCVPPTMAAWHATWVNGFCYGIENVNLGLVKRDNAKAPWRHWPPAKTGAEEWTSLAKYPAGKEPVAVSDHEGFEPFTTAQLIANVMLLRFVGALGGGPLDPQLVLPHSAVQGNKLDAGPLFPIHEVRRLACIALATNPVGVFDSHGVDAVMAPPAGAIASSDDDLDEPWSTKDSRAGVDASVKAAVDALPFVEKDVPNKKHHDAARARQVLDRLGFFVPKTSTPDDVDVWMRRALWAFQTGVKLKVTNEPDTATMAALDKRWLALGNKR